MLKSIPGRLMLALVVIAMVYRGAIPLGYMLAPSSAAPGKLMITLCVTGGGMVSVPVDVSASDDGTAPDGLAALECPFAPMAAQFVLTSVPSLAVPAIAAVRPSPFAAYRPAPPLPAVGPPLGSRAPPHNLA